jgi:hypothetical protein
VSAFQASCRGFESRCCVPDPLFHLALATPEWLELNRQLEAITESSRVELYLARGEGLESVFFVGGVSMNQAACR